MKFSSLPFIAAFLVWLFLNHYETKYSSVTVTWAYGPYLVLIAVAICIVKGIHFCYFNSKKRLAQNAARYMSEGDEDEKTSF